MDLFLVDWNDPDGPSGKFSFGLRKSWYRLMLEFEEEAGIKPINCWHFEMCENEMHVAGSFFSFFCTLIYLCLPCKYFIGFLLLASTMKTELCSFFLTKNKVYSKGVGGIIWKSIHELNHPIQYRNISLLISIYPISLPYLQQHKYCYLAICRSYFEQLQL